MDISLYNSVLQFQGLTTYVSNLELNLHGLERLWLLRVLLS